MPTTPAHAKNNSSVGWLSNQGRTCETNLARQQTSQCSCTCPNASQHIALRRVLLTKCLRFQGVELANCIHASKLISFCDMSVHGVCVDVGPCLLRCVCVGVSGRLYVVMSAMGANRLCGTMFLDVLCWPNLDGPMPSLEKPLKIRCG